MPCMMDERVAAPSSRPSFSPLCDRLSRPPCLFLMVLRYIRRLRDGSVSGSAAWARLAGCLLVQHSRQWYSWERFCDSHRIAACSRLSVGLTVFFFRTASERVLVLFLHVAACACALCEPPHVASALNDENRVECLPFWFTQLQYTDSIQRAQTVFRPLPPCC